MADYTDNLNNRQKNSFSLEGNIKPERLPLFFKILSELYVSKSFEDIGKTILDNFIGFKKGKIFGIKLAVYDYESDQYTTIYHSEMENRTVESIISNPPISLKDLTYFSKVTINQKKTLVIHNSHSSYALKIQPSLKDSDPYSMLFIPLIHKDILVGLFSIAREPVNSFDDEIIDFMENVCKYVSIGINDLLNEKRKEKKIIERIESDEKYRMLVETFPDPIISFNLQGNVVFCNNKTLEVFRYNVIDEFIGKNFIDIVDPDQRDMVEKYFKELFRTGFLENRQYRVLTKTGDIRLIHANVSLIYYPDGKPKSIIAIFRDITEQARIEKVAADSRIDLEGQVKERTADLQSAIDAFQIEIEERKRIEAILRESEERYHKLMEYANDAIFVLNLETGIVVDSNIKAEEIFGIPTSQIIGFHFSKFQKKFDFKSYDEIKNRLLQNKKGFSIVNSFNRFNETVYIEVNYSLYEAGGIKYILGVFRDITERKTMEMEIIRSRNFLQNMIDNIPICVFVRDVRMDKLILWNKAGEAILGYSKTDVIGRTYESLFPRDIALEHRRLDEEAVNSKSVCQIPESFTEYGISGKKYFHIVKIPILNISGDPEYVLGLIDDISEQKESEKIVIESEKKFKKLAETTPAVIFIIKGDKFVYVNKAIEDILGYERGEVIDNSFIQFVHPDFRETVMERFLRRLKGEDTIYQYEMKILKKGGDFIWVELTTNTIDYENSWAIIGTAYNITNRKESEIKLIKASEELEHRVLERTAELLRSNQDLKTEIIRRKQAEDNLKKSEEHYHAIVEDQTELICRFLPKKYTFSFVNQAFCRFYEKSFDVLIGQSIFPFIYKEEIEKVLGEFSNLSIQNPILILEHRVIKPDGSIRWLQGIYRGIFDHNNNLIEIQSVGRDITERLENEQKLEENQRFIQSIMNTSPNLIFIYDIVVKELLYINYQALKIFGFTFEEIVQMGPRIVQKLFPPEEISSIQKSLQEAISKKNGEVVESEIRAFDKNRDLKWFLCRTSVFKRDDSGSTTQILTTAIDITERKKMEKELASHRDQLEQLVQERTTKLMVSNMKLELEIDERKRTQDSLVKSKVILDAIEDGVLTIDDRNIITSFNKGAENIIGIYSSEAIGKSYENIFRIIEPGIKLESLLTNNEKISNIIIHILNKKGLSIPVEITTYLLKSSESPKSEVAVAFHDLSQVEFLRKEIEKDYTFHDIVSRSPRMQQIFQMLPDVAMSDSTVLIQGPTGTGKELLAKAIYNLSRRKEKPLIIVNCGAIPPNLMESELFGYVKGSFTDAKQDKQGKILTANNGTVFFDEIGELPPNMQVKLLRLLENFEVEPIGATTPVKVDIRIIAATNRDLLDLVRRGEFRDDLYYRLNTVKFFLPPLIDRREDIPYLIDHFIKKISAKKGKKTIEISPDALKTLYNYSFPGNIRELEKIIEYSFIVCQGDIIESQHLPPELAIKITPRQDQTVWFEGEMPEMDEKERIIAALRKHNGNKTRASYELKMHYTTLLRKLRKYNLI